MGGFVKALSPMDTTMIIEVERLQQQLDELFALESIYGECFHMTEEQQTTREHLQAVVDGQASYEYGTELQFAVHLEVMASTSDEGGESPPPPLRVGFQLPLNYPEESARADLSQPSEAVLSRDELGELTQQFQSHLNGLVGQECLFPALEWLQGQWERTLQAYENNKSHHEEKPAPEEQGVERVWMYFHHIYSSKKRSAILALSGQLKLGGFCLSGKPGMICIEGADKACEEFVRQLRSWTWKRMTVRLREPIYEEETPPPSVGPERRHTQRCFAVPLREIQLAPSEMRQYLQEHQCDELFSFLYQL